MVQLLHTLGCSISYGRVLEIENELSSAACQSYLDEGAVTPSILELNPSDLDNIDHNPSATTTERSFHGPGISLMQMQTVLNPAISRPTDEIVPEPMKDSKLPEYHKQVQPLCMTTSSVQISNFNPSPTNKSSDVELKENNQIPNLNPSPTNKSSNMVSTNLEYLEKSGNFIGHLENLEKSGIFWSDT